MYLHILKRDLKRKKTMNCIILLFVILSAMFLSSSVNNILSVMGGVDRFLDLSGMKDYWTLMGEPDSGTPFGDLLSQNDKIKSYVREDVLTCTNEMIRKNGTVLSGIGGTAVLVSADRMCIRSFDEDNQPITAVEPGKIRLSAYVADKNNLKKGDRITVEMGGETLTLTFEGICKEAVIGREMVDCPRFILNPEDYDRFYRNDGIRSTFRHGIYLIETDDTNAVNDMISSIGGCRVNVPRSTLKLTYLFEIYAAAIVMALSIFLIVIAFVMLAFTIRFTVSEEFREIGIMKAIGLKNRSIRGLYLVKYLAISVAGSAIGFFAGIPFGKLLLRSVSRNMVLENDHPVLIGILCCAGVVLLILLFCWCCTGRIKKLTPIDAVRSGQTGERFGRKSLLHLGKSRIGANGFLAINDTVSSPKQTALLTIVFTLCTLLVMILSILGETLASDKLMNLVSVTKSDVYLENNSELLYIQNGNKTLRQAEEEIEQKLAENGMPGTVYAECCYNTITELNGKVSNGRFAYCCDTGTQDYFYNKGTAPQNANEVALASITAEECGAKIGDTVNITVCGEKKPFIVTAIFDSMQNLGRCGRFHESVGLPDREMMFTMAFQINFDDHPNDAVINSRVEKLREIFNTEKVFNKADYVDDCTKMSGVTGSAKNLTLIVTLMIIAMMSVLLERSFIAKEKSEIALMKAMGFKNSAVIGIHVLRFLIIAAVSVVIALLLSMPVTALIMDPTFASLGAVSGSDYAFNKTEAFLILPAVILASVVLSVFCTALSMKQIKAADTANIE
ncbi:MAG: FtsX-like permease family protein [Oscillospiraceae bacterium]|nr:FtsX-like permease family protein [Oscillospiraceae bacterium]